MKTPTTLLTACCFVTLLASSALADSLIWSGAGSDQNWSTGGNWTNETAGTLGTVPGAADDVRFFDSSFASPTVDGAFGGSIASLWFLGTNTDYATTIATALSLTGTNGLRVGTNGPNSLVRTAVISGGTLNVSNATAIVAISEGAGGGAGDKAILNLAGLDNFNAGVSGLGVGSANYPSVTSDRYSGDLYLARTNLIALQYSQPLATYATTAARSAFEMGHNPGNNPGTRNSLYLGITNAFFVDSLAIGKTKASAAAACSLLFNPTFLGDSPVAYFRGINGDASRVTWWALGDMNNSASSAQVSYGTNDFTGGRVDALVETMSLGRDCVPNHTATGGQRYNIGVLTFDNGVIDVNTLIVGNQSLAQAGSTSTTPNHGYVNVNSANATLIVNQTLKLADTSAQTHTGAQQTFGRINVDAGTLRANAVTVGANSVTNAALNFANNATFVLSNGLASASKPLRTFSASDSTVVLHLNGSPTVAYVTNLVTGGSANTINIGGSVVFPTYPAQVALFKFTSMSNASSGLGTHNFALGSVPANVVGASFSNNTFNSSLDLYIPIDPRPAVTNDPVGFSGSPGSSVNISVGVAGVSPFSFQWRRSSTNISDGGNLSGATTDTLAFTSAQPANNGPYDVVISNAYGMTTSVVATLTISAGDVAPSLTGPSDASVLQGDTAMLTASASGVPAPALQWFKNGSPLTGETGTTLSIANVQYPADEAIYSLRATNAAGVVSNSARLTVLVPPAITQPPGNVTVLNGSPASFMVVATGHPSPTYLWSKNNNAIQDATNATLSFLGVTPSDAGSYSVLVNNAGGSTNSEPVTLTVTTTTLAATNFSPANGATGICYDTPLYIKFNNAPALGTGTLRIYDSGDNLVDTIDLTQNQPNSAQLRSIAGGSYYTYPVIIRSNLAAIFPHLGVLTSNTTYYVLTDTGFFKDTINASLPAITSPSAWRFTTKVAGPDTATVTNIVVAGDGSADFVTVQGAIDWVLAGNTTPITINLRKGVYEEINRIPSGKNNLTFIGEGCLESVITYANNNSFQLANAGTASRIMFYAGGNDCIFKNLWFANSTPQGGSQAEAIRVQGSRVIVDNCKLTSYQDTILVNTANTSAGYFNKCLVQGDTDFIWGSGIAFFDQCELRGMQRSGNAGGVYTQSRTAAGVYGLIFRDCNLTKSAAGVTNNWTLGRDAGDGNPNGNVAWLNCRMDDHISGAGWTDGGLTDKSTLRFWEYLNRNITDTAYVATSSRVPWSVQLDVATAESVSNPTNVFASILWEPTLATYIACSPTNQTAYFGQTVAITAHVGGVPQPVYQWYQGANPVAGATGETLFIPNAKAADVASYSVRATNDLGYAVSSEGALTLVNPPSLGTPQLLADHNVQFTFSGIPGTGYRIWASPDVAAAPITTAWTLLNSGTFGSPAVTFTDTSATNFVQRYYILTIP